MSYAAQPAILPDNPAIHTVGLAKMFKGKQAVADLTMTVPRGEVFGFLGPNGAGKTTSVKMLVGLTRPTSGDAQVLGSPIGDRESRRKIGYLPELFRYQGWLSAREVMNFHAALLSLPASSRQSGIDDAIELVGLKERANDRSGAFSKGMQQRLGLAVALLGQPDLVFLDEPTSALDPVGRLDVRDIIHALKKRGTTVFLNSHLLTEVEHVCDRVAVVNHGRVIAMGTLQELLDSSGTLRLRATGLTDSIMTLVKTYGSVTEDGAWLIIRSVEQAAIPHLVADIVAGGAHIYAVEPGGQTLEDRFIQLLKGADNAPSHHS